MGSRIRSVSVPRHCVHIKPWDELFELFKVYVTKHGNASIQTAYSTENSYQLSNWVAKQRQAYRKRNLPQEKIDKLESLTGWKWGFANNRWAFMYKLLIAYTQVNENALVPEKYITNCGYRLGRWVAHQRYEYKEDNLSRTRIDKLKTLCGLTFDKL